MTGKNVCEDCGKENCNRIKVLHMGHVKNFLYEFDVHKRLCPFCYCLRTNGGKYEPKLDKSENHTE